MSNSYKASSSPSCNLPNFSTHLPPLTLLHDDIFFVQKNKLPKVSESSSLSDRLDTVQEDFFKDTENMKIGKMSSSEENKKKDEVQANENTLLSENWSNATQKKVGQKENTQEKEVLQAATEEYNAILSKIPIQLLFRSPLPKMFICHEEEPWFECQQDSALTQMWRPVWEKDEKLSRFLRLLTSVPSTTSVYHDLCAKRTSQGVIKSVPYMTNEKESQVLHTRSILGGKNLLREIEELKARERNLLHMKLTLNSRNAIFLVGGKVYPLPQLVKFPTRLSVFPSCSQQYTCWNCLTFTFEEACQAFKILKPPLFCLPPFESIQSSSDADLYTSRFQLPIFVIEHFALAVELKLKQTLSVLVKHFKEQKTHQKKPCITLDVIEQLVQKGELQGFPWDAVGLLSDLYLYRLESSFKRIKETKSLEN